MAATNKVLIVDDELDILEFIQYNLEKEGFEVDTAVNGREAIDKAKKFAPDLILLDVMMPEMDGLDVCRTVKADPDLQHIPVFLVTARAMVQERERGFQAGADDYITKPFANKELLDRVKEIHDAVVTP